MERQKAGVQKSGARRLINMSSQTAHIEASRGYRAWITAKKLLRSQLRADDFDAFVRPLMLLKVLSDKYFLLALPPNRRMFERARQCVAIRAAIRAVGYEFAGITCYPSDEELVWLANNPQWAPWMTPILRGRLRTIEARRAEENARDRSGFAA